LWASYSIRAAAIKRIPVTIGIYIFIGILNSITIDIPTIQSTTWTSRTLRTSYSISTTAIKRIPIAIGIYIFIGILNSITINIPTIQSTAWTCRTLRTS
jgi:uncharacterized oligopeptide transporter (OPT) family protein